MNNTDPATGVAMNLFAWIGISVVLVGMAQFNSTAKLAATFSYLILVAVVLTNGIAASKALTTHLGGSSTIPAGDINSRHGNAP